MESTDYIPYDTIYNMIMKHVLHQSKEIEVKHDLGLFCHDALILCPSWQVCSISDAKHCEGICKIVTRVPQWRCCPCHPAGLLCSASSKCRSAARVLPPMAGCCQLVSGCGQGRKSLWIQAGSASNEEFGSHSS